VIVSKLDEESLFRNIYATILRLLHTIEPLKLSQLFYRPIFKFKQITAPDIADNSLRKVAAILKKELDFQKDFKVTFNFLNNEKSFPVSKIPWDSQAFDEKPEKLWVYNLNYFDFLSDSTYSDSLKQYLILDWIEKNTGRSEGAEPYPTSRRIFSWLDFIALGKLPEKTAECIKASLSRQYCNLKRNPEKHLDANHLSLNLLACFYYASFNADDIKEDLCFFADEITENLSKQFLSDGCHCERSLMYHKELLHFTSKVYQKAEALNKAEMTPELARLAVILKKILQKGKDFAAIMTFPDGYCVQFGDSAKVPNKYVHKQLIKIFKKSGFLVYKKNKITFFMKLSGPSPDYNPGHSHCDLSSYELAINNKRIITDTGCFSYQDPVSRNFSRSSYAHNIAMVEGTEQSDFWGAFRFGKRAKLIRRLKNAAKDSFTAIYEDRYQQRFLRQVHFGDDFIKFEDRLIVRTMQGAFISLVHLAPGFKIKEESNNCFLISNSDTSFKIITDCRLRQTESPYYPEFGKSISRNKLILSNAGNDYIEYTIRF